MKATLAFFFGVLVAVSALAQGTINFANTSTTLLTTNSYVSPPPGQNANASGPTTGAGQYTIGLYIAPQGTTDPNAFTLMGPTTLSQSGLGNGRFNGNPLGPPSGNFVISNNTGQTIAFQVRAWSSFGGETFEEAISSYNPYVYIGNSTIGEITPATGLLVPRSLFGTGAGQVGGFVLYSACLCPEPSTTLLAVIGAAVGLSILRRPSRRKR